MTKLDLQQAKIRLNQLKQTLSEWNHAYFENDQTIFPEAARDKLKAELIEIETQFPELITPDSPSQVVGSDLSEKFEKTEHLTPKKSLDDIFSLEELEDFIKRVQKFLTPDEEKSLDFTLEPKVDGLNLTLIYEKGVLTKAITRGNGLVGENVTHTAKTIQNLPQILPYKIDLEVTGEVFITKQDFKKINQVSTQTYANPRNLAAGSIRQLDPEVSKQRYLKIFLYSIGQYNLYQEKISDPQTQVQLFKFLDELKLPHQDLFFQEKDIQGLSKQIQKLTKSRDSYLYEIDGLVIKVNQFNFRKKLGYKAKTPRYACAYKFPATTLPTKINDITIQVGRTGSLTPVAELEPILIDGTTVSRATLHNQDEIDRKDIRIGDTVIVRKAGDIIPEVVEVLPKFRNGSEQKFQIPDFCPVCNYPAQQEKGEVVKRCSNPKCPAIVQGQFEHFISRQGFNIDGLGTKVIQQLLHEQVIHNPEDIFKLSANQLIDLPLFKEQKTNNILTSIQNSKQIKASNFLYSFGIRTIGIQSSRDIIKSVFPQTGDIITPQDFLDKLSNLTEENFLQIDGFGQTTADYLLEWIQSSDTKQTITALTELGVQIKLPQKTTSNQKLSNQSFLFTGKLTHFDRNTAKTLVENNGGKNASSVSAKLDYLVIGEKPGSKLKKAEELNLKVISEDDFLAMIN